MAQFGYDRTVRLLSETETHLPLDEKVNPAEARRGSV